MNSKTRRVASFLAGIAVALAPALAGAATIYDSAEVVEVKPVYEIVSVAQPREICRTEQVAYRDRYYDDRPRSATGPILGAIIGGAIGNAVGHSKRNKQVGTAVGAVLGGSIGADVSRRRAAARAAGPARYREREVCSVVKDIREEERLAHYLVSYRYGGEIYTTRMDRDPGDTIDVEVRVRPAG